MNQKDIERIIDKTIQEMNIVNDVDFKMELQCFYNYLILKLDTELDKVPDEYKTIYSKKKMKKEDGADFQNRYDLRNLFLVHLLNENLDFELKQEVEKYLKRFRFHDKTLKQKHKEPEIKKQFVKTDEKPTRGVETMFRVTSKNHLDLSALADNKANILISVNVILISIVVSGLVTKLDNNQQFIIPVITILTVAMITIIFATISTIPNVTNFQMTRDDIDARKGNLLFFGNFSKLELEDYEYGINILMNDKKYLYNSMAKDIYFLGKVLDRKYKYLRMAYRIFMFGLIISTISFIISMLGAN